MSTQVLFVQGAGEAVHDAWDDKLVRSLEGELGHGYSVLYPRMPDEADPRYSAWKGALLDLFAALPDGAILVGHSVGGSTLIRVLAEEQPKRRPSAIVLIAAPFIGDGGWPSDEIEPRVNFAGRLPADVPVLLYHGTGDEVVPVEHVRLYQEAIPQACVRALESRDHQLNNDLTEVAHDIRGLSSDGW